MDQLILLNSPKNRKEIRQQPLIKSLRKNIKQNQDFERIFYIVYKGNFEASTF